MPFVLGAVAGGIVGAAVALLYAPVSGDEVRKSVGDKFDDFTEGINEILRNAKTSAEKMLDEGRGTAEDILADMEDSLDDIFDRDHDEASSGGASSGGSTPTAGGSGESNSSSSQAGFREGSGSEGSGYPTL